MTLTHLKDFGDWLSPIIVKELRQGMRTRLFTTAFIVLQAFMVIFMLGGLSEHQGDNNPVIWYLVAITLLLVMPLRGFGALSSEIRLNTMDLIALTRMSAWRITAGKWAALVSQSILLTMAVLPYVVIRYFFGGVNIVAELFYLGLILLLSCLLSAVMVGFSAVANFLVRCILAVGVVIGVIILITSFTAMAADSMSGGTGIPFSHLPNYGWIYVGIILACLFLIYFFLDFAATRIAPEAVNYSTRRRFISLCFFGLLLGVGAIPNMPEEIVATIYVFGGVLVSLFAFDALTEQPSGVRSLHYPFVRLGLPGQIFQFIFTPGWLSGAAYVLLLTAIQFIYERGLNVLEDKSPIDSMTIHVSLAASLMFPLLLMHLFSPRAKDLMAHYFFIQIGVSVAGLCIFGMQSALTNPAIMWAGCPIPFVCYLMATNDVQSNSPALLVLAITTLAITIGVFIWHGWPHIRAMLNFRREYVQEQQEPAPAKAAS